MQAYFAPLRKREIRCSSLSRLAGLYCKRLEEHFEDLCKKETVKHYEKIIFGAGTVFISGPAGFFENEQFSYGTEHLLKAVANSMATTIVSGGHLTFALKKYDLHNKINHVSTAGGALVLYLAREKLPMIAALEWAASNSY